MRATRVHSLPALQFSVLSESYPSPQSCASNSSSTNIGRNSCGIEPDILSLYCTLKYQGNVQPVLVWNSSTGTSVTSTLKSTNNRTTVSTVILKADEQRSTQYTCFVKYFNSSLVSSFSYSLDINIISKYASSSYFYIIHTA